MISTCDRFAAGREVRMSTKVIYDLASGVNPYSAEWLSDSEALPPIYYESGFFHVLPSVLLMKIFPINVYYAATVVHCVYVIIALLMMFLVVRRLTKSSVLAALATNLYFYCLAIGDFANVRPDTLCSLCCILILYLLLRDKEVTFGSVKGRKLIYVPELDKKSGYYAREWLIAFLCVLLVFLKIHYASIIFALFFYYLKKRRVLPMIGKGIVFAGLGVLICNLFFPTFFSTFGVRVIEMLKGNIEVKSIPAMWKKWWQLFCIFPVLFVITVSGIGKFRKFGKDDLGLFFAIHILFNFVALCFMGKWPGNGIIYHEVMLMTMLIPASMWLVSSWVKESEKLRFVVEILVIASSLFFAFRLEGLPRVDFTSKETAIISRQKQIEELDKYASDYMLLSPQLSFYAFEKGMYQWDYGDQIYIPFDIGTSPRWNFLFPYTNEYRRRCYEYCLQMLQLIEEKKYGLIVTDSYNKPGFKLGLDEEFEKTIEENYELIDEGTLNYYVPKE